VIEVPKDVYHSGHTDSECYAKLYGVTREAVEEKAKSYFADYDPRGYGTRYKVPIQQHADGYWHCELCRRRSC